VKPVELPFQSDEEAIKALEDAGYIAFDRTARLSGTPEWIVYKLTGDREPVCAVDSNFTERQLLALLYFHPKYVKQREQIMAFEKPKSNEFCYDTLVALVERGPLEPGNVPSKGGLGELVQRGYAVQVVVKGDASHWAATPQGVQLYINHVLPGKTLSEAIAKRQADWAQGRAQRAIDAAKKTGD
jgi:hypothetical protein